MLTSVTIRNFRTFKDETISLKPITVFIGPNNSGKTSAIRAIQLLAHVARTGRWPGRGHSLGEDYLSQVLEGPRVHQGELRDLWIEATAQFPDQKVEISLQGPARRHDVGAASVRVSGSIAWSVVFNSESRGFKGANGVAYSPQSAPEFLKLVFEQLPLAEEFFARARLASLSVPLLREPSTVTEQPELGERGENFAAVLDWARSKPSLERAIEDELKRTLNIDGFTTQTIADGKKVAATIEGDESFPADAVSDGVLLYLGLTTAAELVGKQSLLMIEEPENGIHPRRLRALLEQVRSVAKRGSQVILTTHSPILLDEFSREPESILVFERDQSGTHVHPVDPKSSEALENGDFGAGSLWFSGAIGGVPS